MSYEDTIMENAPLVQNQQEAVEFSPTPAWPVPPRQLMPLPHVEENVYVSGDDSYIFSTNGNWRYRNYVSDDMSDDDSNYSDEFSDPGADDDSEISWENDDDYYNRTHQIILAGDIPKKL